MVEVGYLTLPELERHKHYWPISRRQMRLLQSRRLGGHLHSNPADGNDSLELDSIETHARRRDRFDSPTESTGFLGGH